MDVARSMMHDQVLPTHLWVEETRKNVCVHNHTSHRLIDNKTPREAFSGVKPEVIHMRIFGFPVHIHVPMEKRTKLDPSRRKGAFVGYSDTSKAYRMYFLGFKKIYISRDVIFDEDSAYFISRRTHI